MIFCRLVRYLFWRAARAPSTPPMASSGDDGSELCGEVMSPRLAHCRDGRDPPASTLAIADGGNVSVPGNVLASIWSGGVKGATGVAGDDASSRTSYSSSWYANDLRWVPLNFSKSPPRKLDSRGVRLAANPTSLEPGASREGEYSGDCGESGTICE